MRLKSFLLILTICIILSLNFVAAADSFNMSSEDILFDSDNEIINSNADNYISENIDGENTDLVSAETKKIYIGHNNNTEGGNGSKDNPFTTFKAACDDIDGEENVTIYVYGGEYKLGEGMISGLTSGKSCPLTFNTSNLNIIGINGSVIIKNFNTVTKNGFSEAFSLTSPSANFTFSNLVFDAVDSVSIFLDEDNPYAKKTTYFFPFFGEANLGIFNNCSFKNFNSKRIAQTLKYNSQFDNCYFEFNNGYLFMTIPANISSIFKNCIFDLDSKSMLANYIYFPSEIFFDNVIFAENKLPSFITPSRSHVYDENDHAVDGYVIPVSRFAIFNVTENYLGNNQYEIIGKLTWNGTEDQEGMENFQPMTVTLESEKGGEIASTVTLVNGTFKTIYTNDAPNHKITATLHNQDINLEFNSVNITADPVSIIYGDDQNITFKFSQVINSTVIITVNNKTYTVKVNESDSLTYTIEDVLTEGNYIVNITLIDEKNHVYGLNSTSLSVSKVDTPFSPNVPAENVKVGDTVTIQVTLPEGATGTVTVYVGDKPFTETASTNTEINITGLIAGNNPIKIVYSGDNKYANKSVEENIFADKVTVPVNKTTLVVDTPTGSTTPTVSINLPKTAKGNLTVSVNGKNYTQELVNGSAKIALTDLPIGNHIALITYSGDEMYDSIIQNTTISFSGIKTNIVAPSVATTYNVAKKLIVTLKDANGNILAGQKVSIQVGTISKTLTTDANGQVSVDISKLVPKTYTATIKFAGDAQHISTSANTKVVVNKQASKITAKKKTFKKAQKVKKYAITLKAGKKAISKVKVTLKIKGKTYNAKTTAKGKATFKIKKLTKKGKYQAVIKFKGNNYFKATTKKVKITLK